MPLIDPQTGEVSNVTHALDSGEAAAGNPSLLDSAVKVAADAPKFLGLSAVAAVNGYINTGMALGRFAGATDKGDVTMHDALDTLGMSDSPVEDYYNQHSQNIEAAGLVLGSLVPGTAAVKGYNIAKEGLIGANMALSTRLLPGLSSDVVADAASALRAGTDINSSLRATKLAYIGANVADNVMQGMVFTAASEAVSHGSPLLSDESFGDAIDHTISGGLVNGVVGGGLGAISILGKFKDAKLQVAGELKDFMTSPELGNLTKYDGGDRVATYMDGISRVKAAVNEAGETISPIQQAYSSRSLNTMIDKSAVALQDIAPNPIAAQSLVKFFASKLDGTPEITEEVANTFRGLKKVSLVTDVASPEAADANTYYINRFPKNQENVQLTDLFTKDPSEAALVSQRFAVEPGAVPKVASWNPAYAKSGAIDFAQYATKDKAFADGYDMYINKDNQTLINPNSSALTQVARPGESRPLGLKEELVYRNTGKLPATSSQPLLSGQIKFGETPTGIGPATLFTNQPRTLNLRTGEFSDSVIPTVADHGDITINAKGVSAGNQTWLHEFNTPSTIEDTPQQAQSRYLWMTQRGLQRGDVLADNDIPAFEQFYKEGLANKAGWGDYVEQAERKGIDVGDAPVTSANDFLNHLQDLKKAAIYESNQAGESIETSAMRANTSMDFAATGAAKTAADAIVPSADLNATKHVQLLYDAGHVNMDNSGNIVKGAIDQQLRIQLIDSAAKSALANYVGGDPSRFIANRTSADATPLGAGSRFLSFSRASYASLGQQMERIGVEVTKFHQSKMQDIYTTLMSPAMALRDDPVGAAEVGNFTAVRRSTGLQYKELPAQLVAKHFPDLIKTGEDGVAKQTGMVAVLKDSLSKDPDGNLIWNRDQLPNGIIDGAASAAGTKGQYNYYTLGDNAANWERANQSINSARVQARNDWLGANGISGKMYQGDILYAPPINMDKTPYFAIIRPKPEAALNDGGHAIVTAPSAEALSAKIAGLQDSYDVLTKNELKLHKEAAGAYEADRSFGQAGVNNDLARRGILNDLVPDTNAHTIIDDYVDWHSKAELGLLRDHIETGNGQLFAELKTLGDISTYGASSIKGAISKTPYVENPYDQYIKTALNIADKDRYSLWHNAQEKLSAFGDQAFEAVRKAFGQASRGDISWEDASAISKKFGLGNPYADLVTGLQKFSPTAADRLPERDVLRRMISVGNSALGTTVINLDTFQQLLHVLSTPILLASESLSASKFIKENLNTELPDGSGRLIPATSKVVFNSVKNFFDEGYRTKFDELYKPFMRDTGTDYRSDLAALRLPWGSKGIQNFSEFADKAVAFGTKWSGASATEHFTSWVAADVAKQLFGDGAGLSGQNLSDQIFSFVNRIKGATIANQRPVAFQGPLGQAVGLFQTYQFNMYQNLLRYVEDGEGKSLASAFALQGTLSGLQGLPGFQYLNNHIVGNAAGNSSHNDFYSGTNDVLGKKLSD